MFTIAGLILLLAGSSWFSEAHTVGVIVLIAGIVVEVIPITLAIIAAAFAANR